MDSVERKWIDKTAHWIRTACILEAAAPKFGNVSPGVAFDNVQFDDFVRSASVTAPILAQAATRGVGRVIRDSVGATQDAVGQNTNLGILLLIAPLAAVPAGRSLRDGIGHVLSALTLCDANLVYEAIAVVSPGGLGHVDQANVHDGPKGTLVDCMTLAAERDLIARQFVTDFAVVLEDGVSALAQANRFSETWRPVILRLQLQLMSRWPDSLIGRKCGPATARESSQMAAEIIRSGWPDTDESQQLARDFDCWLRADGNRRNPGTTADIIAASLFAALRDGWIDPPRLNTPEDAALGISSTFSPRCEDDPRGQD